MFPVVGDEVLLTNKKRGLVRAWTMPLGETRAWRDAPEVHGPSDGRVGVARPTDATKYGELDFRFAGDPFSYVHVYLAAKRSDEPFGTPEGKPAWSDVGDLPYGETWAGDRHWAPSLLDGDAGL